MPIASHLEAVAERSSPVAPSSSTSTGPTGEGSRGEGAPALVLWDEQDDYLPRDHASRLASEIPGAELLLLKSVRAISSSRTSPVKAG